MISTITTDSHISERQRVLFAAGIALCLHLLILLLTPFSSYSERFSGNAERMPQIQLELYQPIKPESLVSSPPLPVIGPALRSIETPQKIAEQTEQNPKDEIIAREPITTTTLQTFLKQETDQFLLNEPKALAGFAATFIAPRASVGLEKTSYQSVYGETHIVTKFGDKQVCYMQSEEHPRDEWSQDLVMFYDCQPKEKFILELP